MGTYNNTDSSIDVAAMQVLKLGEEIRAFEERMFARLEEQQHRFDASLTERMTRLMERLQRIEASLEASEDESDDAAMQAIKDEALLDYINRHENDDLGE